jgi:hypothetical protein
VSALKRSELKAPLGDGRYSANARAFAGLIALVTWTGLAIQFATSAAEFGGFGTAVWRLSLFFTILTNLGVAAIFTGLAAGRPAFGGPRLLGGIMASILLVGVTYSLLLAGTQVLTGGNKYANIFMHYAVPILAPLFWLICVPKGNLRARDPLVWAIYPLTYLAYALVRGGIDGRYPYYFLNVGSIGWTATLVNAAAISAGFLIAGYLIVWIDRRLGKAGSNPSLSMETAPPGA